MPYNYYGSAPYPNINWNTPQSMTNPLQTSYQYAQQPAAQQYGMIGVDGEVGAKAFQMPQGWPSNVPIPLWDTNEQVIYLKSVNSMNMPNPLQKLKYTIEDQQYQAMLPAGNSNQSGNSNQAGPEYVTKGDFENLKNEIKDMLKSQQSNRNNVQQNRGGQQ